MGRYAKRFDDRVQVNSSMFGIWASVTVRDGHTGMWYESWKCSSEEASALAESVISGDCPPGIFADYMDEHPDPTAPSSGPKVAQMLREWVPEEVAAE